MHAIGESPPSSDRGIDSSFRSESPTSAADGEDRGRMTPTLKRTLHLRDIIFYGVGCSVGAGIYSLVGIGSHLAGPSIALSFLLCGVACIFTSLSYAEFAARVPLAGSAYTYAYVSFGELCGWLVGWNLTLGYAVSAAVVARSWAEYFTTFIGGMLGVDDDGEGGVAAVLRWCTRAPLPLFGEDYTCSPLSTVIIAICTAVLVTGAKESARFNTIMTALNLSVLAFVLFAGVGSGSVHGDNLAPVFPHGAAGMARGAGLVFFSYLGFDMVACLSEEVVNPERNLPLGIVGSLLVSMSVYVSISLVVVGMTTTAVLGEDVPIINALLANACCEHSEQLEPDASVACLTYSCSPVLRPLLYHGSRLVAFGAIFGLTTATFACLMGQPRIFFSMAQDGLLFKLYARVHPQTGVPTAGTVVTGAVTAVVACLIDLESLANVISLGTLQVFTFVNAGVILLRMAPNNADEEEGEKNESSGGIDVSFAKSYSAELSPLVRNPTQAAAARSLGIVKRTSGQIRQLSVRSTSSAVSVGDFNDNGSTPGWMTLAFTASAIMCSVSFSHGWGIGYAMVFLLVAVASAAVLFSLPKAPRPETFACPCIPAVPLLGIACNSYMMGSLPLETWSAILSWLLVGLLFYFTYGIHHSELRHVPSQARRCNAAGSGINNQQQDSQKSYGGFDMAMDVKT